MKCTGHLTLFDLSGKVKEVKIGLPTFPKGLVGNTSYGFINTDS